MRGTDTLAVLRSSHAKLCKTWQADGTITQYQSAKVFRVEARQVRGFDELADLLKALETEPNACLIRGKYLGDAEAQQCAQSACEQVPFGQTLRRGGAFADQPLHMLMVDVDGFVPACVDPVRQPLEAAQEYISTTLPECFHSASFYLSLSSSAGHPKHTGKLKAHLFFWLAVPRTSAELREWAATLPVGAVDTSLYQPVQVHYTALPQFSPGVVDPVPQRSFVHKGSSDSVSLDISPAIMARARDRLARSGEPMADPKAKPGLIGAFCRAFEPQDLGRLLPRMFEASRREGHFDWVGHDSKAGVFLTDCEQGLISAYGTAPTGTNRLCNIYDFVRLHLFKQHDIAAPPDCRPSDLPSAKAMRDWIEEHHPHVLEDIWYPASSPEQDFGALEAYGVKDATDRTVQVKATARKLSAASASHLAQTLRRPERCGWHFGYDSFDADIKVIAPDGEPGQWRGLTDNDYTAIRVHLEERLGMAASKELIRDTVAMVASEPGHAFDSAQLWLGGLQWDGKPRVDGFFAHYCKAQDSDYAKAASRYLWTALAGRVLQPGIKADMVPVLVGAQGCRKSSTAEAIAFDSKFFGTIDLGNRDDDTARRMRGRLVLELSELRGLGGRDAESTKEFLSRTDDCWVPKYKERDISNPRRCLFIGTSNRDDFLADATGNRRWLPLIVGQCDPDAVRRDCEQLWAEAAVMFRRHGIEFREAERLAAERHANFTAVDPWEELISSYLDGKEFDDFGDINADWRVGAMPMGKPRDFATTDQLCNVLDLPNDRRTPQTARRIKDIVTRLGWRPVRVKNQRGYQRPDAEPGNWQPVVAGGSSFAASAASH